MPEMAKLYYAAKAVPLTGGHQAYPKWREIYRQTPYQLAVTKYRLNELYADVFPR